MLVDATAVPADRGGVGRYVDGLIAAFGTMGADIAVACQRSDAERFGRMAPDATILPGPAAIAHRPARLAWEQTSLPMVAQQVGAKVVHSPHYTMPLRLGLPSVVTIHDVTFFTQPELIPAIKAPFFRSATKTALHRATRCIVPSKATRDELVRVLAADSTRIDVAYHGVDRSIFHVPDPTETQRVQARLGLRGSAYIAFLGTLEPRKNVPSLIKGWVKAVVDRPEPPALVLAGGSGWDDAIDGAVTDVPPQLRVIRPGYLRFTDLRGFLGGAIIAAYPSHGEGFGLPVLEAMACGTAVLTTPRLSLPEVGGDAVAYTEGDPDSIAVNLAALLDDEPRRQALAEAAVNRAGEFTWAASAEAHLASYARAVSG
ncbi:MAG: glycosyltransferase family 4 protein [Mycobacteriales bacterium]